MSSEMIGLIILSLFFLISKSRTQILPKEQTVLSNNNIKCLLDFKIIFEQHEDYNTKRKYKIILKKP